MNMHRILRTIALAGIIAAGAFGASALDLPVKSVNGHRYYYYEVRFGDTVLSLAKDFGITRDEIIRYNPAAADGIHAGNVLYFPYETFAVDSKATISHEVKRGETLFGLSHRYGVTPDDIIALNPGTQNGLKSGSIILIPSSHDVVANTAQHAATPNETPLYIEEPQPVVAEPQQQEKTAPVGQPAEPAAPAVAEETEEAGEPVGEYSDSIAAQDAAIAVVLPFALGEENMSKQAQLYTDFYKGMLLAAEQLSTQGPHITIRAYDASALNIDDALRSASVIISPEDNIQMAQIAREVADSAAYVLNMFNLKDEDYLTNPTIVQGNIPHTAMYEKAYQGLREHYADLTPLLLHNNNGRNEKSAFIDYIRSRYIADGIAPEEMAYNGTLLSSDLDRLDPAGRYVVVPSSGTLGEFNKMSHALKAYRDDPSTAHIEIFGYPDWTAFRNDAREMLHRLGATIYTRVFFDPESAGAKELVQAFEADYGEAPMEVVPNQGALGHDVASMLIANLRDNYGVFTPETPGVWRGIQSAFHFTRAGEGGFYNDALYIVTFMPDNTTQTNVL